MALEQPLPLAIRKQALPTVWGHRSRSSSKVRLFYLNERNNFWLTYQQNSWWPDGKEAEWQELWHGVVAGGGVNVHLHALQHGHRLLPHQVAAHGTCSFTGARSAFFAYARIYVVNERFNLDGAVLKIIRHMNQKKRERKIKES